MRLGRLRLGAEPLPEQLARYRRVTWALTLVPGVIAAIFLSLFTAFGRPDVGLIVVSLVCAPIVLFAWIDQWILAARVRRYERELASARLTLPVPGQNGAP